MIEPTAGIRSTIRTRPDIHNLVHPGDEMATLDQLFSDNVEASPRNDGAIPFLNETNILPVDYEMADSTKWTDMPPATAEDLITGDISEGLAYEPELSTSESETATIGANTSDSDESTNALPAKKRRKLHVVPQGERVGGPVGLSNAAKSEKASRAAIDNGIVSEKKRLKWKARILNVDKGALFDDKDPLKLRTVRCSVCSNEIRPKSAYETQRFEDHFNACLRRERDASLKRPRTAPQRKVAAIGRTPTIDSMFSAQAAKALRGLALHRKPVPLPVPLPCPGLTELSDGRITRYLLRTMQTGGGSRSVAVLSMEIFDVLYSALNDGRKRTVRDRQYVERRWRNEHQDMRVVAVKCEGMVVTVTDGTDNVQPCFNCKELLLERAFLTAIHKEGGKEENVKFTNIRFLNESVAYQYANVKGLTKLFEASALVRYASHFYTQTHLTCCLAFKS